MLFPHWSGFCAFRKNLTDEKLTTTLERQRNRRMEKTRQELIRQQNEQLAKVTKDWDRIGTVVSTMFVILSGASRRRTGNDGKGSKSRSLGWYPVDGRQRWQRKHSYCGASVPIQPSMLIRLYDTAFTNASQMMVDLQMIPKAGPKWFDYKLCARLSLVITP